MTYSLRSSYRLPGLLFDDRNRDMYLPLKLDGVPTLLKVAERGKANLTGKEVKAEIFKRHCEPAGLTRYGEEGVLLMKGTSVDPVEMWVIADGAVMALSTSYAAVFLHKVGVWMLKYIGYQGETGVVKYAPIELPKDRNMYLTFMMDNWSLNPSELELKTKLTRLPMGEKGYILHQDELQPNPTIELSVLGGEKIIRAAFEGRVFQFGVVQEDEWCGFFKEQGTQESGKRYQIMFRNMAEF